jgi:hypothetical protein
MTRQKKDIKERLLSNMQPDANGCWICTLSPRDKNEHPSSQHRQIWVDGKTLYAHVVSYKTFVGELPLDKPLVLHHCDVPACINPEHLYPGTPQDNFNDMKTRNRAKRAVKGIQPRGEQSEAAKLTNAQANEIRELYKQGKYSLRKIGKQYGICAMTVQRIIKNKRYV